MRSRSSGGASGVGIDRNTVPEMALKVVPVPRASMFFSILRGWMWVTMDILTVEGPQNGLYLPKSAYGSGIPILRIEDYQDGFSRASNELSQVAANEKDVGKYGLGRRDLVINRVNSPSHLGKSLLVESRSLPSLFESNMMRLQLASSVNARFVEVYLRSNPGRARLIANAKWAVNQASINQSDVANTAVPLPPATEQTQVAKELETLLSVAVAAERTLAFASMRVERLRQSILKRAFSGQLGSAATDVQIPFNKMRVEEHANEIS